MSIHLGLEYRERFLDLFATHGNLHTDPTGNNEFFTLAYSWGWYIVDNKNLIALFHWDGEDQDQSDNWFCFARPIVVHDNITRGGSRYFLSIADEKNFTVYDEKMHDTAIRVENGIVQRFSDRIPAVSLPNSIHGTGMMRNGIDIIVRFREICERLLPEETDYGEAESDVETEIIDNPPEVLDQFLENNTEEIREDEYTETLEEAMERSGSPNEISDIDD